MTTPPKPVVSEPRRPSTSRVVRDGHVYSRDASWWQHPDTRTLKAYHWPTRDGWAACCSRIMLDTDSGGVLAVEAPIGLRCSRPACKRHYDNPNPVTVRRIRATRKRRQ